MAVRVICSFFVALVLLGGASSVNAVTDRTAQAFIQDLGEKSFASLADKSLSDQDRNARFRQVFMAAFDIPAISRSVLARHWSKASPAQQAAFLEMFEDAQVLTWARRFAAFAGVRLETLGSVEDGEGGWTVDSRILQSAGPPIPVQWRIHPDANGRYRIIDIISQGVSMVLTCREDYAGALQRSGGDMDNLLSAMKSRNETLRKDAH